MPDEIYRRDFQATMRLSGPILTVVGGLSVATGGLFAAVAAEANVMLPVLAAMLIAATLATKRRIDKLPLVMSGATPDAVAQYLAEQRMAWQRRQASRTVLAVVALMCLCVPLASSPAGWLMVVAGGLWTGGVCIIAVERSRAWQQMAPDNFLADFRISIRSVDPLMPICCLTTVTATAFFSHDAEDGTALLGWIATGVAVIGAVGTGVVSAPAVLSVLRSHDTIPAERIVGYRRIMLVCNAVRAIAALLAFGCIVVAVALDWNL